MLANYVMVLQQHILCHRCCDRLRVLAGCSHTYNKPLPALGNNGLPSLHFNRSLSTLIRPLSFICSLELKYWPIPEWFYSSTGYATGAMMDSECEQGDPIPIRRPYQLWVTMLCLPSTSTDHSPPAIRPLGFWLELK